MKVASNGIQLSRNNYTCNKNNTITTTNASRDTVSFSGRVQNKLIKEGINKLNQLIRAINIIAFKREPLPGERQISIIEGKIEQHNKNKLVFFTYSDFLKDFNKPFKANKHLNNLTILYPTFGIECPSELSAKCNSNRYKQILAKIEYQEGNPYEYASKCIRDITGKILQLLPSNVKHPVSSQYKMPEEEIHKFSIDDQTQEIVIGILNNAKDWREIKRDIVYQFYTSQEKIANTLNEKNLKKDFELLTDMGYDATFVFKDKIYKDFCKENPHHVLSSPNLDRPIQTGLLQV